MLTKSKQYKHCYKIKLIHGIDNENETVEIMGELYGGYLKLDAHLPPGQYWYYTDADKGTLEKSILLEVLK